MSGRKNCMYCDTLISESQVRNKGRKCHLCITSLAELGRNGVDVPSLKNAIDDTAPELDDDKETKEASRSQWKAWISVKRSNFRSRVLTSPIFFV